MEPAELTWRDGVPESTRFGDVYFSRDNGLAETRHVFIEQNHLPERFQAVSANQHFVIAETGFGTGLNLLVAWTEWLKQRPADDSGILHFISVERFPLTPQDLRKALSFWPELAPQAEALLEQYPPLIQGVHRLVLAGGRVRLTLYFGDVLEAWDELQFQADAWFLDGFAPSLNPEMWLAEAISQIRNHSKPGTTTLATFTAVGRIRRALTDAGFTMQKVPGFGRKREMLTGELPAAPPPKSNDALPIAIIGAGIAGTLLAHNLAERGQPVLLIDQGDSPGNAASGNPQGALYVKLGIEFNAQTELAATALSFAQRYYQPWQGQFWHPTGLLQLAATEQEADRQRRFLARNHYPDTLLTPVSSLQASELAGLPVDHSGLWFPRSGWLEPAKACCTLAQHPLITRHTGFRVTGIQRDNEQWRFRNDAGAELLAGPLVIAAGHQSAELLDATGKLRLKSIRGQISGLPAEAFNLPQTVVCGTRYLNPAMGARAVTGATFDLRDDNPQETLDSHRENLEQLVELLPSVCKDALPEPEALNGRVAFRCASHDYLPVASVFTDESGRDIDNLFLLTGLGSKGLAWAPLLAEYLADRLTGQPACLPKRLSKRLSSARLYRK